MFCHHKDRSNQRKHLWNHWKRHQRKLKSFQETKEPDQLLEYAHRIIDRPLYWHRISSLQCSPNYNLVTKSIFWREIFNFWPERVKTGVKPRSKCWTYVKSFVGGAIFPVVIQPYISFTLFWNQIICFVLMFDHNISIQLTSIRSF